MRLTHTMCHSKDGVRHPVSPAGVGPIGIRCIIGVAILVIGAGCRRKPPDLMACTRVEVHYGSRAIDYFFPHTLWQGTILTEQERQHVQSYDVWIVTDQKQINAFADQIRRGRDRGRLFGRILDIPTDITCYRGRKRVASFSIYCMNTVVANGHEFAYQPGLPILRDLDPPGLRPLQARWKCGVNLSALIYEGLWPGLGHRPYLDPNHWCDTVLQSYRNQYHYDLDGKTGRVYPDAGVARRFTCPNIHQATDVNDAGSQTNETDSSDQTPKTWVSDYAMNSNCREGSPKDVVFLFESKPGWNQNGGPELFTFDNHDPKGGLVLLNDGTVKFIRTEEELKQLRWK